MLKIDKRIFLKEVLEEDVPDGYTSCVSNTQRYRMLGNGWTVDVIVEMLKGLNYE